MIALTTHIFFLFTRKEFWFYNGEPIREGTYNTFSAASKIHGGNIRFLEEYQTSVIDLSKPEADLFQAIHPTYRYDIRAAEKHSLTYLPNLTPSRSECRNLMLSYNKFAKSKALRPYSKSWIGAAWRSGHMGLTRMMLDGADVITHVYLFDREKVILTNSFNNPDFLNDRIRSEANKLLHWKDLQLFKSMNFRWYDFGGINPEKHPGISKFKQNFGGETRTNYRYIHAPSLLFSLVNIRKRLAI